MMTGKISAARVKSEAEHSANLSIYNITDIYNSPSAEVFFETVAPNLGARIRGLRLDIQLGSTNPNAIERAHNAFLQISQLPNLEQLAIRDLRIHFFGKKLVYVLQPLLSCTSLQKLELHFQPTKDFFKKLGKKLLHSSCTNLKSLVFGCNQAALDSDSFVSIFKLRQLEELELRGALTAAHLEHAEPYITRLTNLNTLKLEICERSWRASPKLLQYLGKLHITNLSLASVKLASVYSDLPAYLEQGKLRILNLEHSGLIEWHAHVIAQKLAKCTNLESLTLSKNPIGQNGVNAIVTALSGNRHLQNLFLDQTCKLLTKAEGLCQLISENNTLTCLSINHCGITNKVAVKIWQAVSSSTALMRLYIHGNSLSNTSLPNIEEALVRNHSLVMVSLSPNSFDNGYEGTFKRTKQRIAAANPRILSFGGVEDPETHKNMKIFNETMAHARQQIKPETPFQSPHSLEQLRSFMRQIITYSETIGAQLALNENSALVWARTCFAIKATNFLMCKTADRRKVHQTQSTFPEEILFEILKSANIVNCDFSRHH